MFIIGGLVALGVIALIAAFVVIRRPRGETRSGRKGQHQASPTPAEQGAGQPLVGSRGGPTTVVEDPDDLLAEVVTLHQQAYGIEQRLRHLSEVIERTQPTLLAVKSVHPRQAGNDKPGNRA